MMKIKDQERILQKYALAFTKLLDKNIQESEQGNLTKPKKKFIISLSQLSVDTELRPATLSDIFSGKTNLKAITISLILKSLGRSYSEFADQFDYITDKEIADFKSKKYNQSVLRGRPVKRKK